MLYLSVIFFYNIAYNFKGLFLILVIFLRILINLVLWVSVNFIVPE